MRPSSKKKRKITDWLKNDDKSGETHPYPHQDVQDWGEEDQGGAKDEAHDEGVQETSELHAPQTPSGEGEKAEIHEVKPCSEAGDGDQEVQDMSETPPGEQDKTVANDKQKEEMHEATIIYGSWEKV